VTVSFETLNFLTQETLLTKMVGVVVTAT